MKRYFTAILILGLFSACVQKPSASLPQEKYQEDTVVFSSAPESMGMESVPLPKQVSGNIHISRVSSGDVTGTHNVINSHAYTVVSSEDELKELRYTLTYVIIPYDISKQEIGKASKKYKRYKKVLELIQEHQRVEHNISKGDTSQKRKNRFVILSKNSDRKKVDIESYNYKLANRVLDFFRDKYSSRVFNSQGPFLITTTKNILFDKSDKFEFLYLNLSNFNGSAIDQVLGSYKDRLVSDSLDDVGLLEKLHYSLLSFATNFNADMYIIQSAMAGDL